MTVTNFDTAEYLENKEIMAEYLSQILADGDTNELLEALGTIAKAKGMSQIAQETGLGRESLYKTFHAGTNPKFETILKIIQSLGIRMHVTAN